MKKLIAFFMGVCTIAFIGFSIAVLDVGNVSGVNIDNEKNKVTNILENDKDKNEENPKENVEEEKVMAEAKPIDSKEYYKKVEEIVEEECKKYDFDYSVSFRDLKLDEAVYIKNRNSTASSMIKVFIMVEVYNQISYGQIKIFDEVTLKEADKVSGDGILKSKEDGSKFTIRELVEYMISKNDNTAANILIDLVGMDNVNRTIESLGFKNTVLRRKMMDEEKKDKGIENLTSVKDLDMLFNMLYKGECLGNEYDKIMLETLIKCENDTKLLNKLPNDVVAAHKTGELTGVENDGGIIFTDKGDYILNILIERTNKKDAMAVINSISEKVYFLVTTND